MSAVVAQPPTACADGGADEARACSRCGEAFVAQAHWALHVARRHAGPLTPDERDAFERALAEEEAWLQVFRQRVRGALAALVPVVITLGIVLLVYVSGSPLAMALLMIPPAIGFSVLAYILSASGEI